MQDLEDTYSRAVVKLGTEYKLAKRLGVSQAVLSQRKKGKTLSPELWALIADIAGDNPTEALVAATVALNAGKERGGWLREALGKSFPVLGVVAITATLLSAGSDLTGKRRAVPSDDNLWIM